MRPLLISVNTQIDPIKILCYRNIILRQITYRQIIYFSANPLNRKLSCADKRMILCRVRKIKISNFSVLEFHCHAIPGTHKFLSVKAHPLPAISFCHLIVIAFSIHCTILKTRSQHPAYHTNAMIAMK